MLKLFPGLRTAEALEALRIDGESERGIQRNKVTWKCNHGGSNSAKCGLWCSGLGCRYILDTWSLCTCPLLGPR